ncbi:hypothetical protein TIFTF001_053964 [Ficus carica]|uniref:Uncharacterized protein n=1 Tax=Ficus carica TaxID=3494 RepID=A0AA88JFC8_FICCA|nr:hypothetical protein TIFTF001_053961 [Ficus carica]GMN74985.1 hypothetical protein TIFTF001_053962 [Ficus carica]GMN74988.1 hypothetical protein TIFTF001_053963 [Ficus carica]GMN74991.1 hypothetical protein TIFTF001_053964 [Ficus carica]
MDRDPKKPQKKVPLERLGPIGGMEARQPPAPHSEREEHDRERQRKQKNADAEETAPTVFFPTKFCRVYNSPKLTRDSNLRSPDW